MAADLKVQIIVTGKVKNEAGWELSMSVRQGATGKSSAKLKYPLKGPRVDAATLKRLAEELPPAIEQAAAAPPEPTPDTGDTGAATSPGDETENPVGDAIRDKAGEQPEAMPAWANWFEVSFGGVVGSRSFGFDEAGTPTFRSSGTGGIQLDATVWPLAFLAAGGSAALSGLGLGLSYGTNFWPGSTPCWPGGPGGACLPTVDIYQN